MQETEPQTMDEWLLTRPPQIRALAQRFPFNAVYNLRGRPHFLLGFSEVAGGGTPVLILSPVNPAIDYDGACNARLYVCPEHFDSTVPPSLPSVQNSHSPHG